MKKFLKTSLVGLLAAQLLPMSATVLAQESSPEETSSSLEESVSEETTDEAASEESASEETTTGEETDTAAAVDLTSVIENVGALLTEETSTAALMAAKDDYMAFLEQVQIGDLYYGYDLGPSMAEVTEQFTAQVEPLTAEISENEMMLQYVYDSTMFTASEERESLEEDSAEVSDATEESEESIVVESAETVEESSETTEEASTEEMSSEEESEDSGETTVETTPSEDEEIYATFFVYFYDDEAIFTGLVSNYHDVDYATFMDQARVDELGETNAPVSELIAEAPVFTGHGLTIQNEVPVESFVTFSGTNIDDSMNEIFMIVDNQIAIVYDEPLAAGTVGFDFMMYNKQSAYADGLSNEEARLQTASEEEVVPEEETEEAVPEEESEPTEESSVEESSSEESSTEESDSSEESFEESSEEESSEEESSTEESESDSDTTE